TSNLRSSSPQKSPPAGCRLPLWHQSAFRRASKGVAAKACVGGLERASGAPRSAGLVAARAARINN
ncbi:MAG: hypothetical protein Q8R33_12400, partial [Burkholderiales bacterium]|nr:hypothetical protein [Burkholderiales bacterium]